MHEATMDELSRIFAQAKPRARKSKAKFVAASTPGDTHCTRISARNSTIIIGEADGKKI